MIEISTNMSKFPSIFQLVIPSELKSKFSPKRQVPTKFQVGWLGISTVSEIEDFLCSLYSILGKVTKSERGDVMNF